MLLMNTLSLLSESCMLYSAFIHNTVLTVCETSWLVLRGRQIDIILLLLR